MPSSTTPSGFGTALQWVWSDLSGETKCVSIRGVKAKCQLSSVEFLKDQSVAPFYSTYICCSLAKSTAIEFPSTLMAITSNNQNLQTASLKFPQRAPQKLFKKIETFLFHTFYDHDCLYGSLLSVLSFLNVKCTEIFYFIKYYKTTESLSRSVAFDVSPTLFFSVLRCR